MILQQSCADIAAIALQAGAIAFVCSRLDHENNSGVKY